MLILMRGLPGSGKSTIAKKLAAVMNAPILSLDNYFVVDGKYLFNKDKLYGYIKDLHKSIDQFLMSNDNQFTLIVDNTHTRYLEMSTALELANRYCHKVTIVEPNNEWSWNITELHKRNTHNVPLETIQNMYNRWHDFGKIKHYYEKNNLQTPIVYLKMTAE